jgi:biotin transport system substrate-specific component
VILVAGALVAEVAIYAVGVPWLALSCGLGLDKAFAVGVVPFLLGDALKMVLAVGAIRGGRALGLGGGSLPF